jgi:hypothetical protein
VLLLPLDEEVQLPDPEDVEDELLPLPDEDGVLLELEYVPLGLLALEGGRTSYGI